MDLQPNTNANLSVAENRLALSRFCVPIEPNWDTWRDIADATGADIDLCWACGACDNGCPVNQATGRLHPQRLVRMAVYGMLDELLSLPDIWYCVRCKSCLQGCPNRVKPYDLIIYLQAEALRRGLVSIDLLEAYRKLIADFQRVRWRAVAHCFDHTLDDLSHQTWYQWLRKPTSKNVYRSVKLERSLGEAALRQNEMKQQSHGCLTCRECSSGCPITCDGGVFDPLRFIRMATLGLSEELLRSPAIWLCLECQRCTEACTQTVSGHGIIRRLQQQAIENGIVDRDFPARLLAADRIIYPQFLGEIDALIGLYRL